MSTAAEQDAGDRLGTAITSVAIVVSLAASVWLASANLASAQRLRARQTQGTTVPPSGSLTGINALDESEWAIHEDQERTIVLFGVTDPGGLGDMGFWRDVASRARTAAPETAFVGLCVSGGTCNLPPDAAGLLTLLKSMDPAQVHALTTAASQRQAFVYRGQVLQKTLSTRDRQAVVEEIVNFSRQPAGMEGA